MVSVFGLFNGVIDNLNLSHPMTRADMLQAYSNGSTLQARIVFIDQFSKSLRLSLRPHVISMSMCQLPELGSMVEDLSIVSLIKRTGLLLASSLNTISAKEEEEETAVNHEDSSILGVYVHQSSLAYPTDEGFQPLEKGDRLEAHFKIGSKLSMRIKGYHLVEGLVVGSNRPEFMKEAFIHKSDIQIGQVVEALITHINEDGLKMLIGSRVEAICPMIHTSDASSTIKLSKRFKVGQVLNVRVLEYQGKQVVVTHKKTLVNDPLPPLTSVEDCEVGAVATGVVVAINRDTVFVQFYNRVQGTMPINILAKQGVTDLDESFRVGQIVKCVVMEYAKAANRRGYALTLALDIGDTKSLMESVMNPQEIKSTTGIVPCTLLKDDGNSWLVKLPDGRTGFVPNDHLSDLCISKIQLFIPGGQIDAFILSESKSRVMLSMKPLLLATVKSNQSEEKVPSCFADLAPGMIVAGFVHKVDATGVFVRFREGLTVLAPRPNLAERFVSDPSELFKEGVSVRCLVQRVDVNKERAIVTFKHNLVGNSKGPNCYLRSFLHEHWMKYNRQQDNSIIDWKKYPIGSITTATVTTIEKYGTILLADDGVTLMLAKESQKVQVGSKREVLILDMNYESKCMDVSLAPQLIQTVKQKTKQISMGDKVIGTIVFIKESYLGVITNGQLVLVMQADYHCPYKTCSEFTIGQQLQLTVKFSPPVTPSADPSFPHNHCSICTVFSESDAKDQMARVQREAEQADANTAVKLQIGWKDTWTVQEISETEVR